MATPNEKVEEGVTIYYHKFTVTSTYKYEDDKLAYGVIYSINYVKEEYKAYLVAYDIGKIPGTEIKEYAVKYISRQLKPKIIPYTLRYSSTATKTENHKQRYTVSYNNNYVKDKSIKYTVKYTTSYFYENSIKYTVLYNSISADIIKNKVVLLKQKNEEIYDALFQIVGINTNIDDYLIVMNNMPKYQLVEYVTGNNLEYVRYFSEQDLEGLLLFPTVSGTYNILGYILLKDVNINNPIGLDLYNIENDYEKMNTAKSYFFNIEEPSSFQPINIELENTEYEKYNSFSYHYSYDYLNFVTVSVTPIFNLGNNCCFSKEIGQPNQSGGGGVCSPL